MKIIKSFEDLASANEYISQLNELYAKSQLDIEATTKKHSTAEAALIAANNKITELNKLVEAGKSNADLVIELQTTLDQTLAEIGELGNKINLLEKNRGDSSLIVLIKGKSYKLLGNRFITKDGELNAEDLSKNTAELQRMLKIGSGALIPVE